jgi:hypothetical protein
MRSFLALLSVVILSSAAHAAVTEGENLLTNGGFDADQAAFPDAWRPAYASRTSAKNVVFDRTGGPAGKTGSIVLRGDGTTPSEVSVGQQGLILVAGETYKLSAYIRTKGFRSRHAGLVVMDNGWTAEVGLRGFPADSGWTPMEKTFAVMSSSDKTYGVSMFAEDLSGEIGFADLKLVAMSAAARAGSSTQLSNVVAPRLVPWQPLLNRIPRANPRLALKFYGTLPEKQEAYECLVTLVGNAIPQQAVPLKNGSIVVSLAGLPCGDFSMEAVVRHRQTRATVLERVYPISIVEIPATERGSTKQLNNLVAELLNQPVRGTSQPQAFRFVNPRDGWVFVGLTTRTPALGLTVKIDGRDTAITATAGRLEAFRELAMGEHHLTVTGNASAARLVVRSIPEIFANPPYEAGQVKENGSYGWGYWKRHVLQALTTVNSSPPPGDAGAAAKALGLRFLSDFAAASGTDDPANMQAALESTPGMTQPRFDGFASDELFFDEAPGIFDAYTKALWRLADPEHRLIYTWINGRPSIRSLHTDFMSACLNASKGRGRLLFEAYCHPQTDEKAFAAYLDGRITETLRSFRAFFPNAVAGTGIILGPFNQIPIITQEYDPAVDPKYWLDMQVHLIANSPEAVGLAATGYWGLRYCDEEMVRWAFMLMRHYAVEGHKDMLSARYGYKYNPGFLKNCDFADGMAGWVSSPAAAGSIRTETIPHYAESSEGRYRGGTMGDTVCVMTRNADKPNRIGQTAHGLEVGKAYCLQFVTADRQDVTGKVYNPRRYGIDAELAGAEILADRSYVHVDTRQGVGGEREQTNIGKVNLNHIVFRAKSPTQVIAFNDEKANPGEELIMNYVQLTPYLE